MGPKGLKELVKLGMLQNYLAIMHRRVTSECKKRRRVSVQFDFIVMPFALIMAHRSVAPVSKSSRAESDHQFG